MAGADRLALSEHIVFDDLLALARFVLFPADDLTLAALLRSPFCDVEDDSLYRLARSRQTTLWRTLLTRADEAEEWRGAADFLSALQAQAAVLRPFELYSRVLGMRDAAGRKLTVMRIPSPGFIDDGDGRPVPASHMNFLIANRAVIAPIYAERPGEFAVQALEALFPDRTVIGLPSRAILTGGGSFHCITQQEPA